MRKNGKFMSGLTAVVGSALGVTMLSAAPASATQIEHECVGSEVVRCANLEMGSTGVFNAHARVTDTANGGSYQVRVLDVLLEQNWGAGWETLRSAPTDSSWEPYQDVDRSDTFSCGSSPRRTVRATVRVQWMNTNGVISSDWISTPSAYICPRA
ncbi:hypothetical protein ACIBI4_09365 [Streptomyces sp. NPDC050418]|uniref:hypothetical protein n=1 Tax=Streptomyces sp. NPDC050418 TaxID=3365612 RepID=UPI003790325E